MLGRAAQGEGGGQAESGRILRPPSRRARQRRIQTGQAIEVHNTNGSEPHRRARPAVDLQEIEQRLLGVCGMPGAWGLEQAVLASFWVGSQDAAPGVCKRSRRRMYGCKQL